MTKHFQRELEKIKRMLLSLGAMTEERFRMAVEALKTKDTEIAEKIIRADIEIDEKEVEIEEECLKVMALHQPVAGDLRFLVGVIKINNDLERIADQAANISKRVKQIAQGTDSDFMYDYTDMTEKTGVMLKNSLDAFVNQNTELADRVRLMDDEVDKMRNSVYDMIKGEIMKTPERTGYLINMLLVSRHLERIGDHATNIAEEVIYMKEGEIVRHGKQL